MRFFRACACFAWLFVGVLLHNMKAGLACIYSAAELYMLTDTSQVNESSRAVDE